MSKRIFIGIPLSGEVQNAILDVQQTLKKFDWPIRWEVAEKLHITLRFLGNISEKELAHTKSIIIQSVEGVRPFIVSLDGFVAFPNFRFPNVLCIRALDNVALTNLQSKIAHTIEESEIGEFERHPFSGHITIGRAGRSPANYRALKQLEFKARFKVQSIQVVESIFSQHGSQYSIVHTEQLLS